MPTPSRSAGDLRPSVPLLGALLVAAIALRPQLAVIGALAVPIRDGLGVSHAFVGLLTAIPVLCMGLFAPFAPGIAGRLGSGRAMVVVALAIGAAGVARGLTGSALPMLAMTVVVGVATALSGPLQAMFVRSRMADHVVAGTAAYAAGTTAGAALTAALAVPLAVWLGGWQASLVAVSVLSMAGVPVLMSVLRSAPRAASETEPAIAARRPGLGDLPIHRPAVWGLGLLFGLQSCLYYGTAAWLPSAYVERGWDAASAAMLVSISNVIGFVAILAVPILARWGIRRREMLVAAAGACVAGLLGVVVVPDPGYLWAMVLGAGLGMMFTLVQTLPSDAGRDAHETGGAAALMLLAGYLVSAGAPFALGAVRDATGSFSEGLWALVAIGLAMIPLTVVLAPERLRPHALGRDAR
jgi:CP family cyanate transporter-like MFS transporter